MTHILQVKLSDNFYKKNSPTATFVLCRRAESMCLAWVLQSAIVLAERYKLGDKTNNEFLFFNRICARSDNS